ncbi:MAG TPA: ATP-binding protein [Vicinamibacterales bacterium]|nr:ATP-binding protein [Vicinamibacterales bacterium]
MSSIRKEIRWHDRMEARVAAGILLLVALSLSAVVITATRVATRSAVARAADNLEGARAAFDRLVSERAEFAAQQTRLITEGPDFRNAMIHPLVASDVATLTEMAERHRQNVNAQFAIVTTPNGTPTATPGWPNGQPIPPGLQAAIQGAASGEPRRDIVAINDKLMLVTSQPAKFAQAEILGTVTFGFLLDDRVAQQLAQITRADINLVAGNRLSGSSLSQEEQKDIAALLAAGSLGNAAGISEGVRTIGERQFIEGTFPLFPDRTTGAGHLVLLQDWAPTQAFLDELRLALLLAGIGGFVLALGGGLIFSHRTSQPLMDMAAAARDIAGGDWSRTVPARGSAEATTMANAFNDMTRSLRDQSERLKASYLRFSTVTQSARDAIISTDGHGDITFWNRSAESTFGYTESEVIGRPITMLIAESDRAAYKAALPDSNASDLTFGHIIEVTGLRKDGTRFPSEFSLAAVQGREGLAFTAVVRDVIERKQSQDTLRQREEQLRQAQKMEAIGRLAGGVAHDFNNLLMAIHGYAEMLVQNLDEGDERRTDAQEIVKAADRAAGLTRQLLAFSSRQVITQQAVALDQLVQNMRNMLQRLIGPEIQITTEVWPDLTPVLADTTQVEQILVNLVINARDAMPKGGKISIELRNVELDKIGIAAHPGLQPGDYVEMCVSDTGSGMDPETLSRIFEPFFTTKEGGKGMGLGLATVYGIVQQNNGAIEVHSRVGHGTEFHIYLPRATDLGKPAPMLAASGAAGSETILLVEDDDRVRALVSNMLRKNGFTVLLASAGDQALEIATRHRGRIHLLLTDVVMPGLNGRLLSEKLTTTRPDTRVLFMSGYSDDEILRHGVKKNAAHFIQKPFSVDALVHKIRETLASPGRIPTRN